MDADGFTEIRTAAVLGLGLIGGSLARDLSARGVRVLGWDRDEDVVRKAMDAGAVHDSLVDDPTRACDGECVFFAVPVLTAVRALRDFAPHFESARLVTDAGSTKRSIVRAAVELGIGDRFVGSHPLAGDHRSGWEASRAGLFAAAPVYLCPTPSTTDDALRLAIGLWTGVGARPEVVDVDRHDTRLAWTSHLPQTVSTSLALALAQSGIQHDALGPGGRDVTRLAGSSPEVWADILLDNADALAPALAMLAVQFDSVRDAITAGDRARLHHLFSAARGWHGGDR